MSVAGAVRRWRFSPVPSVSVQPSGPKRSNVPLMRCTSPSPMSKTPNFRLELPALKTRMRMSDLFLSALPA